jgi:hypothetical protein
MDKLAQAIEMIKAGQKNDGLRLLIEIVKEDPRNERAWLWLGGTLPDVEKRKDCLRRVLQINPDNQQASRMLRELESVRRKEQHSAPPPQPQETSAPAEEQRPFWADNQQAESKPPVEQPRKKATKKERSLAESKIQRALALHMKDQTQKGLKSLVQGLDIDPNLAGETFTMSVASELTGLHPDQAIAALKDPDKRQELLNPGKEKTRKAAAESTDSQKSSGPPPGLVQSWLSFFGMTEQFFHKVVSGANMEDTMISVLVYTIASVITFFITSFGQLQEVLAMLEGQMGTQMPDLGPYLLIILIGVVIFTPISFFIGAGIQFLGLRLFGGSGTFKEHAYVLGLITVPLTVISLAFSLTSLVPVVRCLAGLAGLGLSIWSLIVTVRGMSVVHDLTTGRTIAGLILPPLILTVGMFCILTLTGTLIGGIFENIISSQGGFPQ